MSAKPPRLPPSALSREERLAKALRDNLARRKTLVRARRSRGPEADATPPAGGEAKTSPDSDEAP